MRSFAAVIFVLSASVVSATTIVSTFGSGRTFDNTSGGGLNVGTYSVAVSFTPSGTVQFGSVDIAAFTMLPQMPPAADLVVSLVADSNGTPGTALESFHFAEASIPEPTGGCVPCGPSLSGTIVTGTSVLNPTLLAGTQYWIEVGSPGDASGYSYIWNHNSLSPQRTGVEAFENGSWTFEANIATPAFDVNSLDSGTVPEPAAGVLFGAGLLALAAMRKRLPARRA